MAIEWIKVEKTTARKPEVLRIASELGISLDHAFGLCVRFWIWCDDNLETGNAPGVTLVTLNAMLGCDKFAETLVKVGWLLVRNGSLEVPNYDRHLSKNAKKRANSQVRTQKHRSRSCNARSVTTALPEEEIEIDNKEIKKKEVVEAFSKELLQQWNTRMGRRDHMTPKRLKAINVRTKDRFFMENYEQALELASRSAFLRGENDRGWKADLEFFLKPDSIAKILEGKYNPKETVSVSDPLAEYEDLDV